jgi:hypothetical protein
MVILEATIVLLFIIDLVILFVGLKSKPTKASAKVWSSTFRRKRAGTA